MLPQSITFSVDFFIKKYKAQNGAARLYLRITINGKFADISRKRRIQLHVWYATNDKMKGASSAVKQLNFYFDQIGL